MKMLLHVLRIIGGYIVSCLVAGFTAAFLFSFSLPEIHGVDRKMDRPGLWAVTIGSVMVLPFLVTVILAENLAERRAYIYAIAGLACPIVLLLLVLGSHVAFNPVVYDRLPVLIISGAVGGFAYWLVAGRYAGMWKRPEA